MSIKELKEKIDNNKVSLIVFEAPGWCQPCKQLSPFIDQIKDENPNILVEKIDVDTNVDLAMEYGIRSVPTSQLYKNGSLIATLKGFIPKKDIQNRIDNLI